MTNDRMTNAAGRAPVSPKKLDRLIDGELDAAERRQVLAELANEPGGWERCALACLESLAWRQASRRLVAETAPVNSASTDYVGTLGGSSTRSRWGLPFAVVAAAAMLAAVFCGGWAIGRRGDAAGVAARSAPSVDDAAQGRTTVTTVAPGQGKSPQSQSSPDRTPLVATRVVVHVLGSIQIDGEDGAKLTVPILAAPGLKVDSAPRSRNVAAHPPNDGDLQLLLSLADGRSIPIPANWVRHSLPRQLSY